MLDHITFGVADLDRAAAFYDQALAPLGLARVASFSAAVTGSVDVIGYGDAGRAYFWITGAETCRGQFHVAFAAPDRPTVDAFHTAAIAAGGTDNGSPGIRAHYHPDYYGAFVLDPEGRNIEAVCRLPE